MLIRSLISNKTLKDELKLAIKTNNELTILITIKI